MTDPAQPLTLSLLLSGGPWAKIETIMDESKVKQEREDIELDDYEEILLTELDDSSLDEIEGLVALDGRGPSPAERERAEKTVAFLRGYVEKAMDPAASAQALHDIGNLLRRTLEDPEGALNACREAFQRAPNVLHIVRGYRLALLRAEGLPGELVGALEAEARSTTRPESRAALELARGRLLEHTLDNVEAARGAYKAALEADATYIPALEALERLAVKRHSPEQAALYAQRIAEAHTDPRLRAEHYARVARSLERAGDPAGALARAASAKVGDHGSPSVSFVLERLLAQEGHIEDFIALRQTQQRQGVIDVAAYWFELGLLRRYRLDDVEGAIDAFERAGEECRGRSELRLVVLRELSPLMKIQENWKRLVELEGQRAVEEPLAIERAAAWHRCGLIFERHLDNAILALQSYEKALEADQGYYPALEGAGRLYQRQGARDQLIAMHLLEAETREGDSEKAAALRRAGELLIDDPNQVEKGLETLTQAVELYPSDLAAFSVLERALIRREAWEGLSKLYEKQLELSLSPTRRAALLRQLAQVAADRLDDRERAIDALRIVDTLDVTPPPDHLNRLASLLEEEEEWEELATVLKRLADRTEEPTQAASHLERLAELHLAQGNLDEAVVAYRNALEFAPPSHAVVLSAARAFLGSQRYDELADLFLQAANEGRPEDQARWLHKAAEVFLEHLDERERALDVLRQAIAIAPDHVPAQHMLEDLLIEGSRWDELRDLLACTPPDPASLIRQGALAEVTGDLTTATGMYAQAVDAGVDIVALALHRCLAASGQWRPLYERYCASDQSALDSRHALYRAAEIAAEQLDDPKNALKLLEGIVAQHPDDLTAMNAILNIETKGDESGRRQSLLAALIDSTDDSNARRAALTSLRIALEDAKDSSDVAQEQLLLIERGLRDPLLTVSVELELEIRGDRKRLVDVLHKMVGSSQLDPKLRADYYARLAEVLEELGALQQATDALETSITTSEDAPSVAAYIAMVRLHGALGDDEEFGEDLVELSRILPSGPERATALRILALHQEQDDEGRIERAITSLEEALKDNPLDYASLRQLDLTLQEINEPERLIHHLMRAFSAEQDLAYVANIGTSLATRLLQLDRLDQALEVLDRTLAVAPTNLEAIKLLAEAHRMSKSWAAAAQRLRQIATHEQADVELQQQALWYLAAILVHQFDDLESAREAAQHLAEITTPDNDALPRLLSVQELVGDYEAAVETLERLTTHDQLPEETRARYALQLGRIQDDVLDLPDKAIEILSTIEHADYQLAALKRILRLSEKTQRWDLTASALERVFEQEHSLEPAIEVRLRRRLAHLLDGKLDRKKDAVPHYERISELEPTDVKSLKRLAELSFAGQPDKALAHHRAVLELQPNRIQSYRALRQLLLRQGDEDAVFCVEAVLDGLGYADEEESYFYAQRRSRLGGQLRGTLDAKQLLYVLPELESPPISLLRAITPVIHRVFTVDVASFSLSPEDGGEVLRSIKDACDYASRVFGVKELNIAIAPSRLGPTILGGTPPTLLVPRSLGEGLPREQLFVCGALIGRATLGGILADPLQLHRTTDQQLKYLLWATCELLVPEFEAPTEENAIYQDIRDRLTQALPTPAPDALAEAAQRFAQADEGHEIDTSALRSELNRAAARAGTLVAIDPSLAIRCLRQWGAMFTADAASLDPLGLSPEAWAGPVFAVSEHYQEIRQMLGTGVRG